MARLIELIVILAVVTDELYTRSRWRLINKHRNLTVNLRILTNTQNKIPLSMGLFSRYVDDPHQLNNQQNVIVIN